MSKADYYRKRHLEMKQFESEEESWQVTLRDFVGLVVCIVIILVVCILAVPKL